MLDSALDWGIREFEFWEMSLNEITRAIDSKRRIKELETKEKAYFDYTLAILNTKGVARILVGSKADYPTLEEAYPEIFVKEAANNQALIEEQKMNLSALRFTQFVNSFNKRYKEVANKINE
jgi:hypothetical protein